MVDPPPKSRSASWSLARAMRVAANGVASPMDTTPPPGVRTSWHVGTRHREPEEYAIHTASPKKTDIGSARSTVGGGLNWQDVVADIDENVSEASEIYQDDGAFLHGIGNNGTDTAALVRELLAGSSGDMHTKNLGISSSTSVNGQSHSRRSSNAVGARQSAVRQSHDIDNRATLEVSEPSLSSTIRVMELQDDSCVDSSAPNSFISSPGPPGPRSSHTSVPPATSKWATPPEAARMVLLQAENAQLRLELKQAHERAQRAEETLTALQLSGGQMIQEVGSREAEKRMQVSPQELLVKFENAALEIQPEDNEVAHLKDKVVHLLRENERLENQQREVARLHEWLQSADPDTPGRSAAVIESLQGACAQNESRHAFSESQGDDSLMRSRNEDSLTTIGESFADHSQVRVQGCDSVSGLLRRNECVEMCNSQIDASDVVMIRQEVLRLRIREQELIKSHERELAEFVFTIDSLREANQRLERHAADEDRLRGAASAMLEEGGQREVPLPFSEFEMFSEQRSHLEKIEASNKRLAGSEQAILTAIANLEEESKVFELRERELTELHDAARSEIENERVESSLQQRKSREELKSEFELRLQPLEQKVESLQQVLLIVEADSEREHELPQQAPNRGNYQLQNELASMDEFRLNEMQELSALAVEIKNVRDLENSAYENQDLQPLEQEVAQLLIKLATTEDMSEARYSEMTIAQEQRTNAVKLEDNLRAELQEAQEIASQQCQESVQFLEQELVSSIRDTDRLRDELKNMVVSNTRLQELLSAQDNHQRMEATEMQNMRDTISRQLQDDIKNKAAVEASLAEMESLQQHFDLELQAECQQNRTIVEEASVVRGTLEKLTQDSLKMGSEEVAEFRHTVDALKSESACFASLEQTIAQLHSSLGSKNSMLEEKERDVEYVLNELQAESSQCDFLKESLQSYKHEIHVLQRSAQELTCTNLEVAPLQCEVAALHDSLQESMAMYQNLDSDSASVALRISELTDESASLNKVLKRQAERLSSALAGETCTTAYEEHERSLRDIGIAASTYVHSHSIEFNTTRTSYRAYLAPLENQLAQLQGALSETQCLQGKLEDQYVLACTRVCTVTEENTACKDLLVESQGRNQKLLAEMGSIQAQHREQLSEEARRFEEARRCEATEQEGVNAQRNEGEVVSLREELHCAKKELEQLQSILSETKSAEARRFAWSPIQTCATHEETPSCLSCSFPDRTLEDMSLNQARLEAQDHLVGGSFSSYSPQTLVSEVLQALDGMQSRLPEDIQTPGSVKPSGEQPSVTALHIHIYMRTEDCKGLNHNFMYLFV